MLEVLRRRLPWLNTPLDVHERVTALGGGPLASSIALAGFLSLFPLLLVGISVFGFVAAGDVDFDAQVVDALGLEGQAADQVLQAIGTAEDSRRAASIVGFLGLAWSGLAVIGALEAALNMTWQTTGRGLTSKLVGIGWLVGAGILFLASLSLGPVINWLPGPAVVPTILLGIVLDTALFLWMFLTLTNVHVHWRAHLPGAIVGGIGLEVLKLVGGVYVPHAVSSSSALYGSIGVVFAVLAWLFFFGRLIVYAATLNVVLWERGHGTTTVEVQVPRIPGRVALEGTRSGDGEKSAEADPVPSA